nr:DUF3298 and DUF4163 domain-containing protein [Parabacteroides pacaensis]
MTLVGGCINSTKKTEANKISFDSIVVDKAYHLLENDSNPNCNLQIKFTYPVKYKDPAILKNIQQIFVDSYFGEEYASLSPAEAVEKYTTDYINAYKDLEQDYKKDVEKARATNGQVGAWYSYYEMSSNDIVYNENNILSFVNRLENYTGGAHGAHAVTNHVINLKTGKLITEQDIFVADYQDTLAKLLVNKIAAQNNVKDPKELENAGFFSVEEIYPNGNFLVKEDGIVYTFNEYEIAAYVVGQTKVFLPYNELQLVLRKDSPISQLTAI